MCTEIAFTIDFVFNIQSDVTTATISHRAVESILVHVTEVTATILTVTSGSSISRPKNFFCCSLFPARIRGVCCKDRYSYLYFTIHTNKLLHKLKNMQASIHDLQLSRKWKNPYPDNEFLNSTWYYCKHCR
jgi:hypothetical protein